MSASPSHPYATYLDIKFPVLSVVDVPALAPDRAVILMVETAAIVPTGDA